MPTGIRLFFDVNCSYVDKTSIYLFFHARKNKTSIYLFFHARKVGVGPLPSEESSGLVVKAHRLCWICCMGLLRRVQGFRFGV
jgi:hypothetical protein